MGSGLVKGRGGTGPLVGLWLWLMAERDGGEGPDGGSELAHMHPFGPEGGVRMTMSPDPGCSVRPGGRIAAHAETRARPVPAFSGAGSSWMRMWKQRASSRRAIAVVAMLLPRRWASWA